MENKGLFKNKNIQHQALASGYIVPDSTRCVQCGICSFNCPIGIDVRRHAYLGSSITADRCLTCGECVARCPRGVLHIGKSNTFVQESKKA